MLEELRQLRNNLLVLESRRDRLVAEGEDTTSIEAMIRWYRLELSALEDR
jgi:hypothetical protein